MCYNPLINFKRSQGAINTPARSNRTKGKFRMASPIVPQKRCTKCGKFKPATAEYFFRQNDRPDGLRSDCKPCSLLTKPRRPILPAFPIDGAFGIHLSGEHVAIVDGCDTDLAALKWTWIKQDKSEYATSQQREGDKRISFRMHRIILARMLGRELLQTEFVDHVDGNGLNNRRENLRLATPSQNSQNSRLRSNNTSGYKGVVLVPETGKWRAQIYYRLDGKLKRRKLGCFDSPELASEAYKNAARELFGDFARFE